jgi:(E)-4-hydroxy-3-methylbut-2-enyl-diphosphate synthase
VARRAKEAHIPLRIGVNSGSLEDSLLRKSLGDDKKIRGYQEERYRQAVAEAMVESALRIISLLEGENFFDIIVSLKSSDVLTTILSYQLISDKIPYPLHLGITATGPSPQGVVRSSIGIGLLLAQGIGDTLRVSLTDDSVEEVRVGYQILSSLHLFEGGPVLISCPTCGRCKVDLNSIVRRVSFRIKDIKSPLTVAIMGCEVNGPGEAKEADIGIACTKKGGVLFKKGKRIKRLKEEEMVDVLLKEIKAGYK